MNQLTVNDSWRRWIVTAPKAPQTRDVRLRERLTELADMRCRIAIDLIGHEHTEIAADQDVVAFDDQAPAHGY